MRHSTRRSSCGKHSAADDGKHALSVIGVDTRLLEPLRRGSLRGRACGADQQACEFTGSGVPKSMLFLALVFMKILVRFGVPFGVPFW